MKHSFIDKYSEGRTLIHTLDPRVKIIFFLVFVLAVTLIPFPRIFSLLFFLLVWLGLVRTSRVPPGYIFSRMLLVLPAIIALAFLAFFKRGMYFSFFLVLKSLICVGILLLLSATTSFVKLLKALEGLRIPELFILILSFMYRYFFILEDELQRMRLALKSRSFRDRRSLIFKSLANFTGLFFIRSYERSERIYQAMCSRGFEGKILLPSVFRLRGRDFVFALIMAFLISTGFLLR